MSSKHPIGKVYDDFLIALNEIINDTHLLKPSGGFFTFNEKKNFDSNGDAKNQELGTHIRIKTHGKSFCFTLECDGLDVFPFFKSPEGKNIKAVNEGFLFSCNKNNIYIIPFEMKSKCIKKAPKQLESGIAFINYLLSIIGLNYNDTAVTNLKDYLIFNPVIFCIKNPNTKSRPTRRPSKPNTKVDNIRDTKIYDINKTYRISELVD